VPPTDPDHPGSHHLVVTPDVEEFEERVSDFLAAKLERNVLATVLVGARTASSGARPPLFAYLVNESGAVTAAAMRTPPWPLLVTEFDTPDRAERLIDAWLPSDPDMTAVDGVPATARAVAAAWAKRTGGRTRCAFREAMHSLTEVTNPPRPTGGTLRQAAEADRSLLVEWETAFIAETGLLGRDEAVRSVDRRLSAGSQFLWEDPTPVSTLAHSPTVAGTARIGPVYTPPEHRARGYASAAVAALSRRVLESGADRCMLFTDLANPTSNKIYASVGYRRFGDWEEHHLAPVSVGDAPGSGADAPASAGDAPAPADDRSPA
jgi:predicted GNAT family acetyltransferase